MTHLQGDHGELTWSNGVDVALAGMIPLTQRNVANGIPTLDAGGLVTSTQLTPGWTAPSLGNSWTNLGGYQTAGYRKSADGDVSLRGIITGGTTSTNIFTLPAGSRPPAADQWRLISNVGTAVVSINSSGQVQVNSYAGGGSNSDVSLSSIRFSTLA